MPSDRSQPRATYRVQLNHEFTLADAARCIPYLARLGISHLYTSPILKARPGSMHGYDVTDHTQLNPELGSTDDFWALVKTLRSHDMGLIVDIVPNHLGIFGSDNQWWLDVLENGPAARSAPYFDIDWCPNRLSLKDRLLVPILGETYGDALERGELRLEYDAEAGEFRLRYHEHVFPIDPREYPRIFADGIPAGMLEEMSSADFASLLNAFSQLPPRTATTDDARTERYRDKEVHKRRLVRLTERDPAVRTCIDAAIARVNGIPGVPSSFDALDALLEAQAYRLAFWRVAADEINYRRFFDVNSLAALRMNDREVFSQTHRLIVELVRSGGIDGLRIDHSDGLHDPQRYFDELREAVEAAGAPSSFYIVTEKILAQHERLRDSWKIQGTTGYEFGALATSWLVDAAAEASLTQTYTQFVGRDEGFEEVAVDGRRLVMRILLAPEIEGLATQLDRIAQSDRHTADFTRPALREAIVEVMACFPVYRTYVSERGATADDEREVDRAVATARRRSIAADTSVFDFLREVLLVAPRRTVTAEQRRAMLAFAMKFQQVSAPVTAKGVEDTALYRFNRLVCVNDVGGDPRRLSASAQAVHQANIERQRQWPLTLLATSTHDTKRGEDVRARLAVLSELPATWRRHVSRWSRLNRSKRGIVQDLPAPGPDDEYLFYQTLLGLWEPQTPAKMLVPRLQAYAVKAAREAKRATSWLNVHQDYESALCRFVERVLDPPARSAFLHDFAKLARIVDYFGHLNSLAQLMLKLTAPGVPDIYQGCEHSTFTLVDPDNRQRVDFAASQQRLARLDETCESTPRDRLLLDLLSAGPAGDAKLLLTTELLRLRKELRELFVEGSYEPLAIGGGMEGHVLAFARAFDTERVIIAISRGTCSLMNAQPGPPIAEVWKDGAIELGSDPMPVEWREQLSRRTVGATSRRIRLCDAFAHWPFAILRPVRD